MGLDEVIPFLLTGLAYSLRSRERTWYVTFDAVKKWEAGILPYLEKEGLLKRVEDTKTLVCDGCTEHCPMEVEVYPATEDGDKRTQTRTEKRVEPQAFIVCDQSDEMGRIPVAMERLQQWMVSLGQLAQWLNRLCGLRQPVESEESETGGEIRWRVGMLTGRRHKGMMYVWGGKEGVVMGGGGHQTLVVDLLKWKENKAITKESKRKEEKKKEKVEIDLLSLRKMVDEPTGSTEKEDKEKRGQRILKRQRMLKAGGIHNYNQFLAKEEGLSLARVKQIVKEAEQLEVEKSKKAKKPSLWKSLEKVGAY